MHWSLSWQHLKKNQKKRDYIMISVVQELLFANADVQSKHSSTAKVHVQWNTKHGLLQIAWCRKRFILTLYSWVCCLIKNRIKIIHWERESYLQWFNNTHFLRKRSRGCSLSSALEANSQLQKGNGILMIQSTCGSFPRKLQTLRPGICALTTST